MFNDCTIGVYNLVSNQALTGAEIKRAEFSFFCGIFTDAIKSGDWLIIDNEEPKTEKEKWAPPAYSQDILDSNKYRLYYQGKWMPCTKEETLGLDKQEMRKPEQLLNKIESELSGFKC